MSFQFGSSGGGEDNKGSSGFSFGSTSFTAGGHGGFSFGGGAASNTAAPASSSGDTGSNASSVATDKASNMTPPFSFGSSSGGSAPAPSFGFGSSAMGSTSTSTPSFGSTPTSTPAPAPAVTAGGFSFGSTTPAPAPAAGTTGGSAFSFGTGTTSAPDVTATVQQTGGEQKVDAPSNTGGFSFGNTISTAAAGGTTSTNTEGGSGAPAPSFSFAATASPAPAPLGATASTTNAFSTTTPATPTPSTPAAPEPVVTPGQPQQAAASLSQELALDYQTMTVEQILNQFQRHLEADTAQFLEEAKRVSEYDGILRDTQRDLSQLTTQTHRLMLHQQDLQGRLSTIDTQQSELDSQLSQVESILESCFHAQSHLTPEDADVEREKAYTTACGVEQRLTTLTQVLKDSLQLLDSQEPQDNKLVQMLNQHQNALAELEITSHRMEHDMKLVQKAMSIPHMR